MPVILDARANGAGSLADTAREMGIRVENGKAIAKVKGGKRVTGLPSVRRRVQAVCLRKSHVTRSPCRAVGRLLFTFIRIAVAS